MEKIYVFKDHIPNENFVLRKKCKEIVLPPSEEILKISKDLERYVALGRNKDDKDKELDWVIPSYGISAPQIGISVRMFHVCVPDSYNNLEKKSDSKNLFKMTFVNPRIISHRNVYGGFGNGEDCLSVDKEYTSFIKRPVMIKVKAYDIITNSEIIIDAYGRLAIIIQHEIDHLNGILFYDRIGEHSEITIEREYIY